MPMQPVQIANSGVTPGRYGNNKQIPVFNVDQRGRLTFAANVDIEPVLNIRVNDVQTSTLNLNTDIVKFQSGEGISVRIDEQGALEFSIDRLHVNQLIEESNISEAIVGEVRGLNGITFVDTNNRVLSNGTLSIAGNQIIGSTVEFDGASAGDNDPAARFICANSNAGIEIDSVSNGDRGPRLDFVAYKNSADNKELVRQHDSLGQIRFYGFISTPGGNRSANLATISSKVLSNPLSEGELPQANIELICTNGRNPADAKVASFNNKGVFAAPVIKTGIYDNEFQRDSSITEPEIGMIVFITSLAKFQGNVDGTSAGWVNLN